LPGHSGRSLRGRQQHIQSSRRGGHRGRGGEALPCSFIDISHYGYLNKNDRSLKDRDLDEAAKAGALLKRVEKEYGIPVINLFYDGLRNPNENLESCVFLSPAEAGRRDANAR
jgi:hypothetical protein